MTSGRILMAAGAAALAALLVAGLIELTGSSSPRTSGSLALSPAQVRARLAGAPPALAALHAQASELLPGGLPALRARLAQLRGMPVVVNKWASWCQPCRAEFGAFQRAALNQGRTVAFIGVDSADTSAADALAFLRSFPVAYPSYFDKSGAAGTAVTYSSFTPVTVFYDRRGGQYIHQGPYPSAAKLESDVRHYALAT